MIGVVSWTLEVSLKLFVWVFFPFFFLPPTESQLHFVWAPGWRRCLAFRARRTRSAWGCLRDFCWPAMEAPLLAALTWKLYCRCADWLCADQILPSSNVSCVENFWLLKMVVIGRTVPNSGSCGVLGLHMYFSAMDCVEQWVYYLLCSELLLLGIWSRWAQNPPQFPNTAFLWQ